MQTLPIRIQKNTKMIYYITGGARSGKSTYAMKKALMLSERPVYIATSRRWDASFENRIKRHKADRDGQWTTIEEELEVSKIDLENKVAVIDCATLWLTNFFVDFRQDVQKCLDAFKSEIDNLRSKNATFIIVSNEIGMGIHADTDTGRDFTDLQGWANQYLAEIADKAYFLVSGIPLPLKE